jgi:hypothetical protein
MDPLLGQLRACAADNTLVFLHYSGHGFDDRGELVVAMCDFHASSDGITGAVLLSSIVDAVEACMPRGGSVVVTFDACRWNIPDSLSVARTAQDHQLCRSRR